MLHSANTSPIPFTKTEIEGSIYQRFQHVAHRVPDHIAVNTLTDHLTYAQLDGISGRVAAAVDSHPLATDNSLVAILLNETHLVMAAIFGILRSGRSVVALPHDSPVDQLRFLWQDTDQPLVITGEKMLELTRQVISQPDGYLCIEDLASIDTPTVDRLVTRDTGGSDLAMISYTSGSTGTPKGVMQSHRLILHTAFQNQSSYHLTPNDRSVVLASLGYGAAKTQCFAALLSGATLYMPNLKESHIRGLVESLSKEQITILAMPPIGLFRQLLDELSSENKLPSVRLAMLGGDDLYQGDVDRFFSVFSSDTSLVFRLAGSEMNLLREIHLHPGMEFPTDKIPVGYAVPDKEVLLLDEGGNEVPQGEIGEIVVRSRYLASGYWRQPELTAVRFKPDPAGSEESTYYTGDLGRVNSLGQMEHLGRKDNMVKIHGFSVHLETVDQALGKLTYVKEGAAAAYPLAGGDKRLVGYLVWDGKGGKPSVRDLRRELSGLLPKHMLPTLFVWLDKLPRTSTGKVERKAFPPAPRERPDIGVNKVAPREIREEELAEIWKRILQLDEVGVEDNFFDLGGDSLNSVQMVMEAEKLLGFTLPRNYFELPTIANLMVFFQEKTNQSEQKGEEFKNGMEKRVKKVSKYQAAIQKILQGKWGVIEIFRRLSWLASDIRLGFLDTLIRKPVLSLPYKDGLKKLSQWARKSWVVNLAYQPQKKVFYRLIEELDIPSYDIDSAFQESVMGNLFSRIATKPFSNDAGYSLLSLLEQQKSTFWVSFCEMIEDTQTEKINDIFPVIGLEYLQQAYQAGRGVILLSYHSTVNRIAVAVLARRLSGEIITTISEKRARRESRYWENNAARDLSARELSSLKAGIALEGQHLLEEGKIVQFVSDNEFEQQGYSVSIFGRRYYLRPGFAELAVNSNAAVVPQYTCMRSDGSISMTILPPFIMNNGDRQSQISGLMVQYAEFITRCWKTAPESIRWSRMMRHFDQPVVT